MSALRVLAIGAIGATIAIATGAVGTYNGVNKGVTIGASCGFELVGVFGPFCTDDIPPCVEEDSAGPCRWDAAERGNGLGLSFTVDAEQHVHYDIEGK